jgi:four helix bundle protein
MKQFFPHEKLDVYIYSLKWAEMARELTDSWPSTMAVSDQLDRATESIVTKLAKAARLRGTDRGIYLRECSLGSVLECAACMDVANRRQLADSPSCREAKLLLQRIARMEVGLRKSWVGSVKEDSESYGADSQDYFLYESIDLYRRSLEVHDILSPLWMSTAKRIRILTRVDQLSTTLTTNIAEGNGRFSQLDHNR